MASSELERKRRWLIRHLLYKEVDCVCPWDRLSKERQDFIIEEGLEEHVKKLGWYWSGKVIEVDIALDKVFGRSLWLITDWGMAFVAMPGDIYSWPDGSWGKSGEICLEDFENEQN